MLAINLRGSASWVWHVRMIKKPPGGQPTMYIEELNRPILALGNTHPAKSLLTAFIKCRQDCVGRHHTWTGRTPIEQEWTSGSDNKIWTFSDFAYTFLAFDLELDGFLTNAPNLTDSELYVAKQFPLLRTLMQECAAAAKRDGNATILPMTDQVLEMLDLWEQYLEYRRRTIANATS